MAQKSFYKKVAAPLDGPDYLPNRVQAFLADEEGKIWSDDLGYNMIVNKGDYFVEDWDSTSIFTMSEESFNEIYAQVSSEEADQIIQEAYAEAQEQLEQLEDEPEPQTEEGMEEIDLTQVDFVPEEEHSIWHSVATQTVSSPSIAVYATSFASYPELESLIQSLKSELEAEPKWWWRFANAWACLWTGRPAFPRQSQSKADKLALYTRLRNFALGTSSASYSRVNWQAPKDQD